MGRLRFENSHGGVFVCAACNAVRTVPFNRSALFKGLHHRRVGTLAHHGRRCLSEQIGCLPIGSGVVPFCGLYLGSYKVIPKRNYYGAYGYAPCL